MKRVLMLTGDVNLMHVTDPAVPFARIVDTLRRADVLFGNLECCFHEPPGGHSLEHEGFHAPPAAARALGIAGYRAVGAANNVNYGADAIRSSLQQLAKVGIPCTGAGLDRRSARAPAIVAHEGLRFGFLQRTSVYWATGHEATDDAPASPCSPAAPRTSRCSRRGAPGFRPRTGPGCPRRSSPGPTRGRSPSSSASFARCAPRPMSWSPPITGDCSRTSSTTRSRSPTPQSTPEPTW